jgi:hypothetical protein
MKALLALLTLIVITIFALFGGVSLPKSSLPIHHSPTVITKPPTPASDKPQGKKSRVVFKDYNHERRYGKNSGAVLSDSRIKAKPMV